MSGTPHPPAGPTLSAWMAERDPPPAAFRPHLASTDPCAGEGDLVDALLAEARRALRDALAGRGERSGAFRLLAADAYLTYACEAALEGDAPGSALLAIVQGLVAEGEEA